MCTICALTIEFAVEHPQSLSVAVATRRAIDDGILPDGITADMDMAQARHHATVLLTRIQQRLERVLPASRLMALPDFFVLMIESRTWGYFRPTLTGFDIMASPAPPRLEPDGDGVRDAVVLISHSTAERLTGGQLRYQEALARGLVVVDGPGPEAAATQSALTTAYPVGRFSEFVCTEVA